VPFKDYMIDMQTMVRPLSYSTKDTLTIIKENCTPSHRIFLRAYKVSDLDTLMILADEYEELKKEHEAFAQENKFSKTMSASPTHAEDAKRQTTRRHGEMTNGHHHTKPDGSRQQTHLAEANGHHLPQQQRQPNNTLWRPPSNTQRPQDATHITDPQEACRKCDGNGHWARGCRNQRLLFCWICGKVGVRSVD